MFLLFFLFLYSTGLLALIGMGAWRALERSTRRTRGRRPGFCECLLLGIIAVTTGCSWLSLLLPIDWPVHAAAAGLVAAWALLDRVYVRNAMLEAWRAAAGKGPLFAVMLAGVVLAAVWAAAGPTSVYDTGLYHAQSVRWINEYGAVPGLGNLHGRLAFNSAWFVFAAFWDWGPLDGKAYHLAGLIAWALGAGLCLEGVRRLAGKAPRISDALQASLLFPLAYYARYAASLSPDLPAQLLVVYAFALAVRALEPEGSFGQEQALLTALACFLPTLKLSMLPAMFLPLLVPAVWRHGGWAIPAAGGILGAFLARNVVLSGYLVYPLPQLNLFSPDWKVPLATAERMRLEVKGWAITPGAQCCAAASQPVGQWFGAWLARTWRIHPAELLALALAPFAGLALGVAGWRGAGLTRRLAHLEALALFAMLLWFFSAPDVRFGQGWIILCAALPAAAWLIPLTTRYRQRFRAVLLPAACLTLAGVLIAGSAPNLNRIQTLLPLPPPPVQSIRTPSGLELYVPTTGDQGWNAPLPGTPTLEPGLTRRGPGLRDGFRIVLPAP